ncbi:2-dehydro-3-deoxygalactonokinase [Pelagovum sp. HNIBRBA483]|uniref:2-dehydro-3-deoxygalactonokinase n=1 Tax=Pelagovum sp. HNIBRBA483 TaxID=3233341 RepID=UPI0034A3A1B3
MTKQNADWIAVDWGTSTLRAWLMAADGTVLERRRSDSGMGALAHAEFEPALLALIGDALSCDRVIPVVCCGMVGSRQGWAEAPYASVPCAPPGIAQATQVAGSDPRIAAFILPGIKQNSPADVMRGEETQIAGVLAADPDFDGILCLPGTHTKWVHISAGEIVSFRTFMTGEMFALLSGQSVLRHSVAAEGWDEDAFENAVSDAMSRPERVAAALFSLRAETLLNGLSGASARACLSGLLIGTELAAARPYWLGQAVRIVGAEAIAAPYLAALQAQAADVTAIADEEITLRGLMRAYATLPETVE